MTISASPFSLRLPDSTIPGPEGKPAYPIERSMRVPDSWPALLPRRVRPVADRKARLRILATSDLHGHLFPWDYERACNRPGLGLASTARLIAEARAEVANCVLVDNGDFLQGSALADLAATDDGPDPVVDAMNRMGYAAAALGNHEFTLGLPHLRRALEGAAFPVLSANLLRDRGPAPGADLPFTAAATLIDLALDDGRGGRLPLRLGILGFSPPQTLVWDADRIGGAIRARGILDSARHHVPALRARGADLVLALCHAGLGPPDADDADEDVATALAAQGGIDALVAGHSHRLFPDPGHPVFPSLDPVRGTACGVPVVMPGHSGHHLGVIDLDLHHGPGGWQVATARTALRSTADPPPRPRRAIPEAPSAPRAGAPDVALRTPGTVAREALTLDCAAHDRALRLLEQPVGHSLLRLHTHFARLADSAALRLVAEAQAAHVRAQLAGTALQDLPVLAAVAPFRTGGRGGPDQVTDIPPGPLRLRHVRDLYIHPNRIAALRLTGAEIAGWLERGALQFLGLAPGARDLPLIDPGVPAFAFETIPALDWTVDLSAPPGQRIRDLCFDGRPLDPSARFVLATNDYRASGSGDFPGCRPENRVDVGSARVQDVILDHIARGPVTAGIRRAWCFAPLPGATALVTASPGALDVVADTGLDLTDAGPAPGGLRYLRLAL